MKAESTHLVWIRLTVKIVADFFGGIDPFHDIVDDEEEEEQTFCSPEGTQCSGEEQREKNRKESAFRKQELQQLFHWQASNCGQELSQGPYQVHWSN
ncbi:hypothetical protein ILYODFUR_018635 [Ilyodon furcidens]|uniref:Uncharacterized protein n=1 Tax=Ilyodon furcidens TaxID=33524 RepID=A0ABV0VHH7_9TELE